MARFIPPHPAKGTAAAKAWAEKMRRARAAKRRTRDGLESVDWLVTDLRTGERFIVDYRTSQKYYGKHGYHTEMFHGQVPARTRQNPGEKEHMELARAAHAQVQGAEYPEEKAMYKGMEMAHRDSARIERVRTKRGMKRNPGGPFKEFPISARDAQALVESIGRRLPKEGYQVMYVPPHSSPEQGWTVTKRGGKYFFVRMATSDYVSNPIALYGLGNPRPRKSKLTALYSIVCTANGCTFLREHLTKSEANRQGCSHANSCQHDVSVVLEKPPKANPGTLRKISAKVEGVVYNRVKEVRGEKTVYRPGLYRHPFKRGVQQLALDNGDLLLHSTTGTPLWERA